MADEASGPRSNSDDSNSDADQLSESHDDEDAGPMPGVENPAVAHAPEPEAIVPAGIGNGGGNGLEPLGAGRRIIPVHCFKLTTKLFTIS